MQKTKGPYATRRREEREKEQKKEEESGKKEGVGGWLMILCLTKKLQRNVLCILQVPGRRGGFWVQEGGTRQIRDATDAHQRQAQRPGQTGEGQNTMVVNNACRRVRVSVYCVCVCLFVCVCVCVCVRVLNTTQCQM